jgi:DNA polymerase/3'-5' exonuclease PolX
MQNDEIAKVLDEVGDCLELAGENLFRVRAYVLNTGPLKSLHLRS